MDKAVVEGIKELGRVAIAGAIAAALAALQSGSIDYRVIVVAAVIAALKAADKYVHVSDLPANGLLPF